MYTSSSNLWTDEYERSPYHPLMHIEPRLLVFTKGVRWRIAGAVGIGLLAVGLGIARLGLLGWLIGQVFLGRPLSELVPSVLLIALVMVLRGLAEHWRAVVAHGTAALVQKKLRRILYDQVASLGPGTVGRQRSGGLTLSMIDGVEQLETYFGQFLPQFMIALLSPILIFAVVAFVDLPVATVMLGFALFALLAPALWHKWDVKNSRRRQTAYASFAAEFLDSIQGLATLKAFGQGKTRADKLEVEARDLFRRTMWVLGTNSLARGITDASIAGGAATALIYGAMRVEAGTMSLSALLIILMLGIEIFRPMRELRSVLHQGMVGLSAAQGIYRILDDKPTVADAAPARLGDGLHRALAPTIEFEDVRFAYPGTRRTVHDSLSFRAQAGERLGLVGPSGGGKSSIVRLLLRFYDPDHGRILLGGHDLRTLPFAEIRSLISVVNQDTFLFHGTVEENIRLGRPEATQQDLEDAARAANIHDFILSMPQGYATVIGEKGIKLSGGQRQRVAIARALLRDTPILVLDEALSAVDAENEAVIQEALDRLMQGRTTLILAHRLSSVIDCDRILVLDGGKVAEQGRHDALMARGGVYAGLMAEQAREQRTPGALATIAMPQKVESVSDTPGGALKTVTEGIIKAEGLTWYQVVIALMKVILPWKGKLTATFTLGVLRVIAFIGVGVLSALIVLALKNHQPYAGYAIALAIVAPLSGILHWFESWLAHDMAFRLLAEMRIDAFRKLDALAPAYLVRRRTGDLMALATHDIELVEYFFAHTVAPAFVAILVPAAVVAVLAWANGWLAVALLPFLLAVGLSPFLMRKRVDRLGSQAREAAGELGAFAVDFGAGPGRDRRLPAGRCARRQARRALAAPHQPAPALLQRAHAAARHPRSADRAGRPRRGRGWRPAGPAWRHRCRPAAVAHHPRHGGLPAGVGDRPDRPAARRYAGRHAACLCARQRADPGARRARRAAARRRRSACPREGELQLSRPDTPGAERRQLRHPRRQDGGPGRHLGRRQDHDGAAPDALLGRRFRPYHAERRGPARLQARRASPPDRPGRPGYLPVQRQPARQHPDRPARRLGSRAARRRSGTPR